MCLPYFCLHSFLCQSQLFVFNEGCLPPSPSSPTIAVIMQGRYGDIAILFIVQVIKVADSNLKFVNILTSQLPPAHFIPIIYQGRAATADNIITNPAWDVIERYLAVC